MSHIMNSVDNSINFSPLITGNSNRENLLRKSTVRDLTGDCSNCLNYLTSVPNLIFNACKQLCKKASLKTESLRFKCLGDSTSQSAVINWKNTIENTDPSEKIYILLGLEMLPEKMRRALPLGTVALVEELISTHDINRIDEIKGSLLNNCLYLINYRPLLASVIRIWSSFKATLGISSPIISPEDLSSKGIIPLTLPKIFPKILINESLRISTLSDENQQEEEIVTMLVILNQCLKRSLPQDIGII